MMNDSDAKKRVVVNLAYWLVAILVHPVIRLFPGESGTTPKFFEFLVPLFMVGLAIGSTLLLAGAIRAAKK
jgi:hypothetical protein